MRGRTQREDRAALELWVLSRLAVFLLGAAAALALDEEREGVAVWRRWDADLLRKVAEHGYDGYPADYPDRGIEAFFPGFPLVLRAVHALVPDWTLAGLVVSAAAGAVAAVALARLGGRRAVLLWLTAPSAVFLAAGYTEALFLALAVPAWLAARDGRWALAGVLCAGACAVRVNGLFLLAGLAVVWLTSGRRLRDGAWLLLPLVVVGAYSAYLHALTGSWTRWLDAQEEGWGRRPTWPWDALGTTLDMAGGSGAFAYVAQLEIAAVAVGVLLTAELLRRRAWGEATYVGLTVTALATSTFWLSVARSSLLWFPLFVLLAQARPAVQRAWLAVCAPLAALGVVLLTTGSWAG